jgi:hypothetical protein
MSITQTIKIAFDIDDTLIMSNIVTGDVNIPNYENIAVYRYFQAQGYHMILWSGSGIDWAKIWGEKLGLKPDEIRVKQKSDDVDIAFDDCEVNLAKVNIKVKRIANNISRELWNKTKYLN